MEGVLILNVVDKCTGWSETHAMRTRHLGHIFEAFKRIQLYQHGLAKTITGENELHKCAFLNMCNDYGIQFVPKPANFTRKMVKESVKKDPLGHSSADLGPSELRYTLITS